MSEGFLTNLKTAEFFFRVCSRYKINGKEARTALMRQLVKRNKVKYLRDVAAVTEGKTVLRITRKGTANEN